MGFVFGPKQGGKGPVSVSFLETYVVFPHVLALVPTRWILLDRPSGCVILIAICFCFCFNSFLFCVVGGCDWCDFQIWPVDL